MVMIYKVMGMDEGKNGRRVMGSMDEGRNGGRVMVIYIYIGWS